MSEPIKDNWLTLNLDWVWDGVMELLIFMDCESTESATLGRCMMKSKGMGRDVCALLSNNLKNHTKKL